MVANAAMMIYGTARIQDCIRADDTTGINDRARANHRTQTNVSACGQNRLRMTHCYKSFAKLGKLGKQAQPLSVISDSNYYSVVGNPINRVERSQHS